MKTVCGILALLLGLAAASEPKQYPVTKVVDLLKDMQTKLEQEAEDDEAVDEKMKCWCTSTEEEKTTSIAATTAHISSLESTIDSTIADISRLNSEITGHQEDLEKSQASLASATAQREKQAATFKKEEAELEQSLLSVTLAIKTLSKKTSFLSSTKTQQEQEKALELLHNLQMKHSAMLMGIISPHQRKLVLALTSARVSKQSAPTGPVDDYTPASSEVLGIMEQMKDTFETNLNETRDAEASSKSSFVSLSAAKSDEIKATEDALVEKGSQLAATKTKQAESKEDLEDSKESLASDQKFKADAAAKCADFDAEYAERVKSRTEEIDGCSKAQAILTDDANRDVFSKTLGFMQLSSVKKNQEKAAAVLNAAALKAHDTKLAAFAVTVRLDTFDAVKKEIDSLKGSLTTAQAEEVTQKDSCVERLSSNALDMQQTTNDETQTESKLKGYEASVTKTNASMNTIKGEIQQLQKDLVTAEEHKNASVKEFQQTITDQTNAQTALNQALTVLQQVYEKPRGKSLLQKKATQAPQTASQDQPKGFKDYAPSSGATGAVGLLTQIIGDSKVMVKEAQVGMAEAISDFASFQEDTTSSMATKNKSLIDLGLQKSETTEHVLSTSDTLQELKATGTALAEKNSALHEECDFLIKNFDLRQEARSQEMEALDTAKAYLNGMQGNVTA